MVWRNIIRFGELRIEMSDGKGNLTRAENRMKWKHGRKERKKEKASSEWMKRNWRKEAHRNGNSTCHNSDTDAVLKCDQFLSLVWEHWGKRHVAELCVFQIAFLSWVLALAPWFTELRCLFSLGRHISKEDQKVRWRQLLHVWKHRLLKPNYGENENDILKCTELMPVSVLSGILSCGNGSGTDLRWILRGRLLQAWKADTGVW